MGYILRGMPPEYESGRFLVGPVSKDQLYRHVVAVSPIFKLIIERLLSCFTRAFLRFTICEGLCEGVSITCEGLCEGVSIVVSVSVSVTSLMTERLLSGLSREPAVRWVTPTFGLQRPEATHPSGVSDVLSARSSGPLFQALSSAPSLVLSLRRNEGTPSSPS